MKQVLAIVALIATVQADTPANCTFEDVKGEWTFYIGEKGHDNTLNCTGFDSSQSVTKLKVTLLFPDRAFDANGNEGFWTLIYNQGFEVVIMGRKYFAFSKYVGQESYCSETLPGWAHDVSGRDWACFYGQFHSKNILHFLVFVRGNIVGFEVVITGRKYFAFSKYVGQESYCSETLPGWAHDVSGRDWACFTGTKNENVPVKSTHSVNKLPKFPHKLLYRNDPSFINKINSQQKTWMAAHYPQFEGKDLEYMIRMAGGRKSRIPSIPKPARKTLKQVLMDSSLPKSFDWRDVNGINYVSPVRNQGGCGSCFAFSSLGMNEARWRIMSNNTETPIFSPQDVVECSEYSQGCEGGFPYLIGGKYAEDFGLVDEECNPYKGRDGKCMTQKSCKRYYSTRYEYVGGFYGACNEVMMKMNLVKNGPMAVAFEVYDDFFHYSSGIYHHTGLQNEFNPFEITNHAVLLVGYGTDTTTDPENPQDYWIVKNSWGESWGLDGYFKIRRGTDECSIESIAVQSFPIL